MGEGSLGPLLRRGRGVGGGDQMPLPAGRRQELAGLLLAGAMLGHLGGAARGLQRGFVVDQHLVHRGPQSSRSRNDRPSPVGRGLEARRAHRCASRKGEGRASAARSDPHPFAQV